MVNPYGGERMRLYQQFKPFPAEGLPLPAPIEPLEQVSGRFEHKCAHRHLVIRHSVVLDVAPELGTECLPELWEPLPVSHGPCPGIDPLEFLAQPRAAGFHFRHHRPASRPPPIERKPKKEGLGPAAVLLCALGERDELGFLLV